MVSDKLHRPLDQKGSGSRRVTGQSVGKLAGSGRSSRVQVQKSDPCPTLLPGAARASLATPLFSLLVVTTHRLHRMLL